MGVCGVVVIVVVTHDGVEITTGEVGVTQVRVAIRGKATALLLPAGLTVGEHRIVIEQWGTAGTGHTAQVRTGHGRAAGTFLLTCSLAAGRRAVDDCGGLILDSGQAEDGCRSFVRCQSITVRGIGDGYGIRIRRSCIRVQNRYGDSFTAFLRNGPQTHLRTDLTQDGNLVT